MDIGYRFGNGEGEMERGQQGEGDGEGGNRVGEMGRGNGEGGERERQAHRMPGWNEVTVFSDFVYPCNAGYPS